MEINFLAVGIATVLQFIFGAFWYSPLAFGKIWMKIHNCDKLSKAELQKMQQEMMPFYGVQLLMTVITTLVLAILITKLPDFSALNLAFHIWLGFVVPTQVSAVVFGGDDKKWFVKKLSIMAGAALICLVIAALVLTAFK